MRKRLSTRKINKKIEDIHFMARKKHALEQEIKKIEEEIATLSVPCPVCLSLVGEPCKNPTPHSERRAFWVRAKELLWGKDEPSSQVNPLLTKQKDS